MADDRGDSILKRARGIFHEFYTRQARQPYKTNYMYYNCVLRIEDWCAKGPVSASPYLKWTKRTPRSNVRACATCPAKK